MSEKEYAAPELVLTVAHPSVSRWSLDRIYADAQIAVEEVEAFLASPEHADDLESSACAHFVLGAARAVLGELNTAETHLDSAEHLFTQLGNELGVAHVTVRRDLVWHQREEFHHAFETFPAALAIARKHQDGWLETAIHSDLGLINLRIGNIGEGVESLFAALAVAEMGSDRLQETVIRMNLATAFIELQDFEAAAVWLRQCLATPTTERIDEILYECKQALAVCEEQLGNREVALELLNDAVAIASRLEFPIGLAESSYDEGQARYRFGQIDESVLAFHRAMENFRRVESPVAHARLTMCQWWLERINNVFTRETYEELVKISAERAIAPYARAFDLYDALAQSAEALGLTKEALDHMRESRRLAKEYMEEIANRQAQVALKRHQLATAERVAEQERRHREELAVALAAAEALNRENQALLAKLRTQSVILEQQATEDALTGIGNRRYFDTQLDRELNRSREFDRSISVALADIDNFKEINDRNSHHVGDKVLIAVASILRSTLRDTDVVARYGGEEFAFIFPEADGALALRLAESARMALERYCWEDLALGLTVTASIGLITRVGPVTSTQIVSAADALLYLAKHAGKNQVQHRVVNDSSIDAHALFTGDRSSIWASAQ
jgi:diguanylate cyclase (GGDEF)-like protein